MLRKFLLCCALSSLLGSATATADTRASPGSLSAAQIIERNVAARGGLSAWRAVQTMTYKGKLEAGGKQSVQLPFVMEMKRPRKTRVELEFANEKAVQVYDGQHGWKVRPYLGRRDVEPFSADELKASSVEYDLDGPLVDASAKGIQVVVEGIEKVEGHEAYKLKLLQKDRPARHLWVDAQSFLEVKIEGVPRRLDGRMRPVEIYYRDYRRVAGLMIPYVLETSVEGVQQTHKLIIESASVNPRLEDSRFTAPKAT